MLELVLIVLYVLGLCGVIGITPICIMGLIVVGLNIVIEIIKAINRR